MKLRSSWPVVASTILSMLDSEKLSLVHALFKSVKLMLTLHFAFSFTRLDCRASQSG